MRTLELIQESQNFLDSGDFEKAMDKLNLAIVLDPDNIDVKKCQVDVLIQLDKTTEALEVVNDLLISEPDDVNLLLTKGVCLSDLDNPVEALRIYERLFSITNDYYPAIGARGIAYAKAGQLDNALQDINTVLKADPKNLIFLSQRALIYIDKQNFKLALSDLDKALRIDKNLEQARLNRAFVLRMLGEKDKALEDMEQVDSSEEFDAEVFHQKGIVYFKNKNYQNALECYNRAIELDPEHVEVVYSRSLVFCELGEFDKSLKDLNSAMKLENSHFMDFLLNGFAFIYYKMRDFDKAIEYANRTLKEYQEFYWGHLTLAEIYGELDQKDKFYDNLEKAINGGIGLEDIDKHIRDKYSKDRQFKKLTRKLKKYGPYG